ncbi:MAG TPA: riboflavin synthase [Candidatus Acidoferrum sp.]|jgi:riboflavin synthase
MFTGIIEHLGAIESLALGGDGGRVVVHAPTLVARLAVSNSIAVSGCCLTVVSLGKETFSADLSGETLRRTSFGAAGQMAVGSRVNLEQPLTAGKEFGGHFVLGHVDGIGQVTELRRDGESWLFGVRVPSEFARYVVPKGSITVDGISLTVANWRENIVEVAVIPFTYEHTNLRDRRAGDAVNLEGDVLGKYVESHLEARDAAKMGGKKLKIQGLVDDGF